jgi:hypothetical protein
MEAPGWASIAAEQAQRVSISIAPSEPPWLLAELLVRQSEPIILTPHCKENPIYVFFFWELHGLSPNFHIHVSEPL